MKNILTGRADLARAFVSGGEELQEALAHLLGFEAVVEPRRVDLTVPRHRRPRARPGIRVHESLAFDLAGATAVDGIPVTGVGRTILDCAPGETKPIRLLDDALRRRIVTWPELWDCLLAHDVTGRDVARSRRMAK